MSKILHFTQIINNNMNMVAGKFQTETIKNFKKLIIKAGKVATKNGLPEMTTKERPKHLMVG